MNLTKYKIKEFFEKDWVPLYIHTNDLLKVKYTYNLKFPSTWSENLGNNSMIIIVLILYTNSVSRILWLK